MKPSTAMTQEGTGRYLPVIYPEELTFWEGCKKRELWLQRCSGCNNIRFPIGPACPECFDMNFTWEQLSGEGVIHNYVVYHKAWTPWLQAKVPYAVIQVELKEGPRLTTNLLDCPLDQIKIGDSVAADYEVITDEITLIQFRRTSDANK